jgi:hypothetical protein
VPNLTETRKELGSVENKKDLFASVEWKKSKSIVLPATRILANLFAWLSLFTWVRYSMAHYKKPNRPWMADTYVILLLVVLVLGLTMSGEGNVRLWLVVFAVYVLVDALGSVIRDVVISPTKYNDQYGPYISVYDGTRWLALALLNVIEVVLCFAILFLYYGQQFSPSIAEPTTAIYFSFVTFVSLGYGDIKPICLSTKILVCFEIFTFILFLAIRLPAAVSILRVKEEPTGPKKTRSEK